MGRRNDTAEHSISPAIKLVGSAVWRGLFHDRRQAKAKEALATHHPEYLSPDQDAQLKAAFKIID